MNQQSITGKTFLFALILIAVFSCADDVFAQTDEVLIVRQKAKTTIKPKAKLVSNKVGIVRKVSMRVVNQNRADNEEVIETFVLNKLKK